MKFNLSVRKQRKLGQRRRRQRWRWGRQKRNWFSKQNSSPTRLTNYVVKWQLTMSSNGLPPPVTWDPAVEKKGKKRSETPQKESASEASWAVDWAGYCSVHFARRLNFFFHFFPQLQSLVPGYSLEIMHRRSLYVTLPWKENSWITTNRKRHLKREFVLFQTSSILFNFIQFVKCWRSFSGES